MDNSQAANKDALPTTDVKKIHPKSETKRYSEIFRDFDNLDLSIISCAGEELLDDADTQSVTESDSAEGKEQHDTCCEESLFPLKRDEASEPDGSQSAQEADLALCRCEDGVETALQYTKMWCRYAKDLLAWMEKRISLEQEFAKNVIKTAEGAKTNVGHQEMMPLQYIYTMALEQDIKNSVTSRKTSELLQNRCYQALASKKNEIDKWRREFKEQWAREQRRMNESVTSMKKARQQYFQRCDELEKAKAISAKTVEDAAAFKTLDKRRKSKDEAQAKVMEAELQYRQCLNDAKIQQNELVKVKERIICHIRKLICQGDSVLKEATVNMFYYQRQQTEPVPLGYHNLEMTCRSLEPGEPYLFYILSKHRPEHPLQVFAFQDYVPPGKGNKRKTSNHLGSPLEPPADDNAFGRASNGKKKGCSDSESIGGSLESLSSPAHPTRRLPKPASTLTISSDDLDDREIASESEGIETQLVKARLLSRAVLTHQLKKMKSKMIKCKQCDNYIVVSGVECEECGLALHRKCMESCQLECENRKGTVFGVDLSVIPRDKQDEVPFVVLQCTAEIEHRALSVQGVYRVSGSKPRIQKLCQAFETQKEPVDLSEYSPHDITSILKQFFKELPEPLLTFDLYDGFVTVGKNIQHRHEREPQLDTNEIMEITHNLQDLLQKLPSHCYSTLQHLISHLQKVSENDENKMSPSNLGIVFGPTLLRPLVSTDMSLLALLETSYQAALVEFLIIHHDGIFGLKRTSCTPPPPAPEAPLPDTPPRASCPLEGEVNSEHETSSREGPVSVEQNRTVNRESIEGCISGKSSWNETVEQLSSGTSERAVLAMREPFCAAQDDAVEEPVVDMMTQTHYRFTRQPVKYYRHHNPRTRLHRPGHTPGQPGAPTRDSLETAEDSLSAGTQGPSHHLCAQSDQISGQGAASGHKADAPLSPQDVVKYMLGLDATFTSAASETPPYTTWSPLEVADGGQAGWTMTRPLNQAPKTFPTANNPSSPAHMILSGLKLRRSQSGRDEQLFV